MVLLLAAGTSDGDIDLNRRAALLPMVIPYAVLSAFAYVAMFVLLDRLFVVRRADTSPDPMEATEK
jgi:hypothetical protein